MSTQVSPGQLLVAAPALSDPNFSDSVVLVLDSDADGTLGVILNRPSPVSIGEVLPQWRGIPSDPDVLFRGGPVSTDGALAVGILTRGDDEPVGFRRVVDLFGVVDLDAPTELTAGAIAGMRVYAGYAGWGAGQLADEIARGDWLVVPAIASDITRADVTTLWRDVLRRQPGELAWNATRPVDPEMN